MGLKFRRGSTAQQSGSLAFGEPYVNTTLGTLVVGGPDGDIVLSAGGTGSTGNFGAISGSGLDITGNANIAGNLTLGGQLTIGDNTSDTVNVVASLSSSLIPSATNTFDLGSVNYFWRDLYISTGSIKFVGAAGTVVGTLSNTANGLNLDGGIVTNGNSSFGTSSLSVTHITGSLRVSGSLTTIGTAKFDRDILIGSSANDYEKITVGFGPGILSQHLATNLAVGTSNLTSLEPDFATSKGVFNTAVGNSILTFVTTGSFNTVVGGQAGSSMEAGVTHNTAIGYRAGSHNGGNSNTYIGALAGSEGNRSSANIGIGYVALSSDTLNASSQHNIGIGMVAGNYLSGSSSNNIIIGREGGPQSATDESNKLYIGHAGYPLLTGSLAEGALSLTINGETQISGAAKATSFSGQILANNGVVSGSSQLTSSFDSRYVLESETGSLQTSITNLNSFTSSIDTTIKTKLDADGVISSSAQLTTTFDSRYLNTGADSVVSGSSQIDLTATTNYASGILTRLNAVGVFSGSSQVSLGSASGNIALATQTTGDYVASLVAGTGVTLSNNSGENATPTIAIGQAVATSSNVQFNSLGIGMAASATAGRIDATNDIVAFSSSDIRFKENITPIENALDKISKISGNTYDWKAENKIEHGYEGNDVGVIAQEIEAVLPQLVQTRENGFKAVKYDKLVALLIQGIKEQQVQIEELKAKIGL